MKTMLLALTLFQVAAVSGQPRSDRWNDKLFGPVKIVVETNSQSECTERTLRPYAGSVAITNYDPEGNKTTEAYDPSFCFSPVIHYSHDPDGSVRSYQESNRCGNMQLQLPLYKIMRDYDSAGNMLKEDYYRGGTLVSRVEYTYDGKGRLVKKETFQTAEPTKLGNHRTRSTASDKFKPFTTAEVYRYRAGGFPEKITFLRDGKALWTYSYEYVFDLRGNWTKRIAVQHPETVRVPNLKTVSCRELTYY